MRLLGDKTPEGALITAVVLADGELVALTERRPAPLPPRFVRLEFQAPLGVYPDEYTPCVEA